MKGEPDGEHAGDDLGDEAGDEAGDDFGDVEADPAGTFTCKALRIIFFNIFVCVFD